MKKIFLSVITLYLSLLISCIPSKYTVDYDLDGGVVDSELITTYKKNDKIDLPQPTKEGYIFAGWINENNLFIEEINNQNYRLKACWIEEFTYTTIDETEIFSQQENDYMLYVYRDGCTWCEKIKNQVLIYLYKTSFPQYHNSKKLYIINLNEDGVRKTIFRKYTGENGQEDGDFFINNTTNYLDMYIPSTPCLINISTINNILTAELKASGATKVVEEIYKGLEEDTSVTQNNITQYVINFDVNGGEMDIDKMVFSSNNITLPVPTKEGYFFVGWVEDTLFIDKVEYKNYSLTAIWSNNYTYTTINEDQLFELPENEYYVYVYRDGCSWCEKIKQDVLRYLYKTSLPQYVGSKKLYVINLTENGKSATIFRTYSGDDGEGDNGKYYVSKAKSYEEIYIASTPVLLSATTINNTTKMSLVTIGATNVVKAINSGLKFSSIPNEQKTKYIINYNLDGGSLQEGTKAYFYSWDSYNLPTPTKEGYVFVGWYEGDIKIESVVGKNYELKAHWENKIIPDKINANEIFNQNYEEYYVYFIKNTSPYLEEITEKAIIYQTINGTKKPIYCVNLSEKDNYYINGSYDGENGQGPNGKYFVDNVTNWDDLIISRTPSLILIRTINGIKTSYFVNDGITIVTYLQENNQ